MTPPELIQKYNVPVPRYTSYPTANNFREYTNEEYMKAIWNPARMCLIFFLRPMVRPHNRRVL